MALYVVGNVCVDDTFYVERLPKPGETINAVATLRGVGGKGANQAVAAARAGAKVVFCAALGADPDAVFVRAALTADLPLSGLVVLDTPTDRSTILVDAAGENLVITAAASAKAFNPTTLRDWPGQGDHLLMQGNLTEGVTTACLKMAKDKGATTIVNPSPLGASQIPEADVIIVNALEADTLSGSSDPDEAAYNLSRHGAARVVVTLGAAGALYVDRGAPRIEHVAAPKVAAIDTSGAGDVFAGALSGCLAQGRSLTFAVNIGVAASALAVTRRGTLAACPSRSEMTAFIQGQSRTFP